MIWKICLFFCLLFISFAAYGIDTNSAGNQGLFYIPTARTLREGQILAGISYAKPHNVAYTSLGFIDQLELTLKLSQIELTSGPIIDKSLDAKLLVIPEMEYIPALAIGGQDVMGSQYLKSGYAVASKRIGDMDLTLGYGIDGLSGWFGGWELKLPKLKLWGLDKYINETDFIVEVNTSGLSMGPNSFYPRTQIIGLRVKPLQDIQIDLAIDNNNQIIGNAVVSVPLDWHLFNWSNDTYYSGDIETKKYSQLEWEKVIDKVFYYADNEGFYNLAGDLNANHLYVEYENGHYYSDVKATGRMMRIAFANMPQDVDWAYFVPKVRNLRTVIIKANKQKYFDYMFGKISDTQFSDSLTFIDMAAFRSDPAYRPPTKIQSVYRNVGLMPGLENHYEDSDAFYKCRLAVDIWGYTELWNGASAYGTIKAPFYNTIDAPYKNLYTRLYYGLISQFINLGNGFYANADLGFLTEDFAGLDFELLKMFGHERLWVGVNCSTIYQRYENAFIATDPTVNYQSYFGECFVKVPELKFDVGIKAGQFVYGDVGYRAEVTKYFNDAKLGAWYSRTNFGDMYGTGDYDDKGIIISVPLNIFYRNDSKDVFATTFTPWGTYVGYTVSPYGSAVFNTMRKNDAADIRALIKSIKE
ncbi:MAG: YjbH domain-containing protein [Candidatus Margulisiibacteriota bacterium]